MPIVTQSRVVKGSPAPYYWRRIRTPSYLYRWDGYTNGDVTQTTTSFRSGSKYDGEHDAESELFGAGSKSATGSRADFMAALRESDRRLQYDNGNEFLTVSRKKVLTVPSAAAGWGNNYYVGWFDPGFSVALGEYPPDDSPTLSKINLDGTRAFGQFAPTKSEAGLVQFLAELREDLPRGPGILALQRAINGRLRTLRGAGRTAADEYLNWQFGIQPTVGDIQAFARAAADLGVRIKQYQRNSDTIVRKKVLLYDERSSRQYADETNEPISLIMGSDNGTFRTSEIYDSATSIAVSDVIEQRCWFSAAYSYHVENVNNVFGRLLKHAERANNLLGIRLDVDTAYELTPFSWLVDWFSDVGALITNITELANDNLVMRYGYVMNETITTRMRARGLTGRTGSFLGQGFYGPSSCGSIATVHTKRRTRATPYGFGLDLSSLSATRWAILGALGMTQGPRTLRH